jgi:tyrosine-protein kinase Etk/Wzc
MRVTDIQPEPAINSVERESLHLDSPMPEREISVLDLLAIVLERKRFIVRFVLGAAILATIVAFVLPKTYEGKVVLLPPAQSSSIGAGLLSQLGGMGGMGSLGSLASLAGGNLGLKNPADMYVALLTSRTVEDAVVNDFGLMKEYDEKRMSDARKELERRTSAVAGAKDGLIRLTVEDHDPKRAADLANGYVDEFRKLSASLAVTEAARRRLFFEQQLRQAKDNLSTAEEALTKTQQTTGVLQIDSQAKALIESAAILRAQVEAKQVQIEGLRSFATEDNPRLVLAKQELAALQSELSRVAGSKQDAGSDINLSKGRVTQSGMEYLRRYRDVKYQETVFELLAKEFEVAKLDEAREGSIVQVVDAAVVPDRKASPHRLWIILGATVFAFLIAIFWSWLSSRLHYSLNLPENRQRVHIIKSLWQTKTEQV